MKVSVIKVKESLMIFAKLEETKMTTKRENSETESYAGPGGMA